MAAVEPARKRLTTFTIESIVGRSNASPSKPSSPPSTRCADDARAQDRRSPSRKPTSDSRSVSTPTSSPRSAVVPGPTSAGRHLELLARFAVPNLAGGSGSGLFSTSAVLDGGNAGATSLAETLLRAGGHLPPYAAVELVNRANGFPGPATAPTLQGQASTLDGTGPTSLTLLRGSMWNPHDLARRIPSQGWSASLVHPLTTGVRPAADHMYMQNPYAGK